jgi:hypothetical protein
MTRVLIRQRHDGHFIAICAQRPAILPNHEDSRNQLGLANAAEGGRRFYVSIPT